MNNIFPI